MKRAYLVIACLLFVAAIVAGVISMRQARELPPSQPAMPEPRPLPPVSAPIEEPGLGETVQPVQPPQPVATAIQASHTFAKSVHNISGTMQVPTPCHELKVEARIMESYPEQVVVDFNIVDTGAICVQVIADKPWSVEFIASEQARISARVNGQPAQFVWDNK